MGGPESAYQGWNWYGPLLGLCAALGAAHGVTVARRLWPMPDSDNLIARVELALASAKRVERESRMLKTTLARLRDELQNSQSQEDTENANRTVEGRHSNP